MASTSSMNSYAPLCVESCIPVCHTTLLVELPHVWRIAAMHPPEARKRSRASRSQLAGVAQRQAKEAKKSEKAEWAADQTPGKVKKA